MKKQIAEVQNYFIDKITNCEFDSYEISEVLNNWIDFKTEIEGMKINFSIRLKTQYTNNPLYCAQSSDLKVIVPNDRLQNVIALITAEQAKVRAEKIEKLKAELAELEPQV